MSLAAAVWFATEISRSVVIVPVHAVAMPPFTQGVVFVDVMPVAGDSSDIPVAWSLIPSSSSYHILAFSLSSSFLFSCLLFLRSRFSPCSRNQVTSRDSLPRLGILGR